MTTTKTIASWRAYDDDADDEDASAPAEVIGGAHRPRHAFGLTTTKPGTTSAVTAVTVSAVSAFVTAKVLVGWVK